MLANPFYRNSVISESGRFTTVALESQLYSSRGSTAPSLDDFDTQAEPGDEEPLVFLTGEENTELVEAVYRVMNRHEGPGFRVHDHATRAS